MKYELKLDFNEKSILENCIVETYFTNGDRGKISKIKIPLLIEKEDINFTVLKGLNGMTARIFNPDLIDGTLRVSIQEDDDYIRLIPCSLYCVKENERYTFY
jgi:hypothetical protein